MDWTNVTLYDVVLAKYASTYMSQKGFAEHAFFCNSKEAVNTFGDAVYFIEKTWLDRATRDIYGS